MGWGERVARDPSSERLELLIFLEPQNLVVEMPHGAKHHSAVQAWQVQGASDTSRKQPALGVCVLQPARPRGNGVTQILNCEPTQVACPVGKQVGKCLLFRGICLLSPSIPLSLGDVPYGSRVCASKAEMNQQVPAPQEGSQSINNPHLLSAYCMPSTELRTRQALILFNPGEDPVSVVIV